MDWDMMLLIMGYHVCPGENNLSQEVSSHFFAAVE